ncbi:MAG: alpha/beta fold hydrolase [Pseudomonadota bacterium]
MTDSQLQPALYALSGGAGPDVVLMHGLFGMGSNLGSVARSLQGSFRTHQLDLPHHGRSPWLGELSLSGLACHVGEYLATALASPVVLVGHSLGGKVAMQLAMDQPELVHSLVVADIAPVTYRGSHDRVFAGIRDVSMSAPASRREATEILGRHIDDTGVIQFLVLSLYRDEDKIYRWRFNASGLEESYSSLLEAPQGDGFRGPILFVHGGQSEYWHPAAERRALQLFANARIESIPDTGHWLHVEKPGEFNSLVARFLEANQ